MQPRYRAADAAPETLLHAGAPEGGQRGAVGLVEGRLEDQLHTQRIRHRLQHSTACPGWEHVKMP